MNTVTRPLSSVEIEVGRAARWFGIFVTITVIALGAALFTGATTAFNVGVFALFAVLWIGFAAALMALPTTLDLTWSALRSQRALVQAVAWLLFLPIAAALFVWEREWHVAYRLAIVSGFGAVNLFTFFPR